MNVPIRQKVWHALSFLRHYFTYPSNISSISKSLKHLLLSIFSAIFVYYMIFISFEHRIVNSILSAIFYELGYVKYMSAINIPLVTINFFIMSFIFSAFVAICFGLSFFLTYMKNIRNDVLKKLLLVFSYVLRLSVIMYSLFLLYVFVLYIYMMILGVRESTLHEHIHYTLGVAVSHSWYVIIISIVIFGVFISVAFRKASYTESSSKLNRFWCFLQRYLTVRWLMIGMISVFIGAYLSVIPTFGNVLNRDSADDLHIYLLRHKLPNPDTRHMMRAIPKDDIKYCFDKYNMDPLKIKNCLNDFLLQTSGYRSYCKVKYEMQS